MVRDAWLGASVTSRATLALTAALAASSLAAPLGQDPLPILASPAGEDARARKGCDGCASADPAPPLLGTLVDTHSAARLALDDVEPTQARFDELLRDPVLGAVHPIDPALLGLVRALATRHPLAHIDVVSGFRSPKLNEALRKKGHHVASHSQHSLGRALDLRVIPDGPDGSTAFDPAALAAEIRGMGWRGGMGIYLSPNDRFVHADVGPLRTWYGK